MPVDYPLLQNLIGPILAFIAGILGIAFGAFKAGQLSKVNSFKASITALNSRIDYVDERIQSLSDRMDRLMDKIGRIEP